MVDEFIQWLSAQNWKIIPAETATPIPEDVLSRYGHAIPQSWLNFAGKLAKCEDQTGNKWFLVGPDFKPAKTEDDWSWNELELMGLDAAGKDKKWAKEVTDFWDTHFPIYLCTDPEYYYYAIDIEDGSVITSTEPDFEERAKRVAGSFPEFLAKIVSGAIKL